MATNNQVNVGLSGATGTGNFVGSTSPTLVTPTLGAASATSITFTSTSGIIGTTTNDSAAAGSVGEILQQIVTAASPVSLTTNTAKTVATITLTAGDWDVYGNLQTSGTIIAIAQCGISTTNNTLPNGEYQFYTQPTSASVVGLIAPFRTFQVANATTTPIYLVINSQGTGSLVGYGQLIARRRR